MNAEVEAERDRELLVAFVDWLDVHATTCEHQMIQVEMDDIDVFLVSRDPGVYEWHDLEARQPVERSIESQRASLAAEIREDMRQEEQARKQADAVGLTVPGVNTPPEMKQYPCSTCGKMFAIPDEDVPFECGECFHKATAHYPDAQVITTKPDYTHIVNHLNHVNAEIYHLQLALAEIMDKGFFVLASRLRTSINSLVDVRSELMGIKERM